LTSVNFSMSPLPSNTQNYNYDATGNLTQEVNGSTTQTDIGYISYNDMPQSITKSSGTSYYRYDASNMRTVKEISPTDKEYYFEGVVVDQTGAVKSYQTSEGYATPDGTTVDYFYYVKDWQGTNRSVIDATGTPVNAYDHYPYGLRMPNRHFVTDGEGNRYQFTGHQYDEETTFEYHGARYYNRLLGRYMSVDPLASQFFNWSTYNYTMDNPINLVDPTGMAPEDWVKKENGSIYWDKNANNQASTKAGETYLGKELNFVFNSYIDKNLWDGPGGSSPTGDKLTSTITLKASENSKGELTGVSGSFASVIGETPVGEARAFYPGKGGYKQTRNAEQKMNDDGTFQSFKVVFEQHASVSPEEEFGLNRMGYKIVDVAQKLVLVQNKNHLWVGSYTDVFPSATLSVNGHQLMQYNQPSFVGTHTAPTTGDYLPPWFKQDFSYYPSKLYKR